MAPKIQWPLVLFSMLAGCGGCAFAFAGIANALGESVDVTFAATVAGFVFAVVGGLFSMKHLASPKHAMYAVQHLLSFSGISVELIMLGITCVLMVGFGLCCYWIDAPALRMALGIVGAIAGVGLAFATGHGYLISSKPTWNTKKLPVAYTATSLVAGGFLYLAVASAFGAVASQNHVCVLLTLACALFSIVSVAVYMQHLGPERNQSYPGLYHWGIVALGMAVPLASALCALVLSGPAALATCAVIGFAGSLVGGTCLRMVMWIVGAGFLAFFDEAQARRSVLLNC